MSVLTNKKAHVAEVFTHSLLSNRGFALNFAFFVFFVAINAEARFVNPEIEKAPVVQVKQAAVPGKADSLLPRGKTWKLVWHDEFDGAEIDKTKWMCRESFWP